MGPSPKGGTIYNLLFCDTETTGTGADDKLIQLATLLSSKDSRETVNELFNPGMPISIGAMAVNHITNKMVEAAPLFKGGVTALTLQEQLNNPDTIFIAHNAPFDIGMVQKEGVSVGKYICTQKVAKHLDPKGVIESYRLQYLRYYFGFEIEAMAHDALGDVLVLEQLFHKELTTLMKNYPDESIDDLINKMIEMSQTPVLLPKMPFGKHKDWAFSKIPLSYLAWAIKNMKDLDPDLLYTMRHYLPRTTK